jgi:hypothetical protein
MVFLVRRYVGVNGQDRQASARRICGSVGIAVPVFDGNKFLSLEEYVICMKS